jgi:vancomycin resistance protein YoaR
MNFPLRPIVVADKRNIGIGILPRAALCAALLLAPVFARAATPILTYRYDHLLFTVNPVLYPQWKHQTETWMYGGMQIVPQQSWRVDGDTVPPLPAEVQKTAGSDWDRAAIAATLYARIGSAFEREPGTVAISNTGTGGAVVFDGVGLTGRRILMDDLVTLTIAAMERGIADIQMPVEEIQPQITAIPQELRDRGITEVIAVGESNFAGSPLNRRHNIAVGLSRFNGHIVPKGTTFSFNEVLGPVTQATGYKPELVIMGDKTLPEYGGGLCQVSTTAYRGIWEYGFPIEQRRNHSFAVAYYGPQGTDATIYPPNTDMKFVNDGPSDLLIQTHVDGDQAYYIYYGTRDARTAEIVGPYTWGHTAAPAAKTEYTTDIPPGTTRKVGSAVPGLRAAWFRIVQMPDAESATEGYYSFYEARPLYHQIGVTAEEMPAQPGAEAPSWLLAPPTDAVEPGELPAPIIEPERLNPRSLREDR